MGFLLDSDIQEICDGLKYEAREFAGSRILITGARGFLGRYFTDVFLRLNAQVLRDPCEIIAIDNLVTSGVLGSEMPRDRNFAFVNHDIIKPFHPERPVNYILHLAGIASPYYYRKMPLATLQVATTGLQNMLEIANKDSARLLFFSSSEIYGNPDKDNVPTQESYPGHVSCLGARACYDESKRLGETLVRVYQQEFSVRGSIVRPFNVYGPGMQKLDFRVLPNFAAKILSGEPVTIYGDGNQTRTFCYVTDAIRGFLQVLIKGVPGEPYNIGNPQPEITMRDLFGEIAKIRPEAQHKIAAHPDSYPADEPQRRCPDISKARIQVGYEPVVALPDGLKRFFDWAEVAYRT